MVPVFNTHLAVNRTNLVKPKAGPKLVLHLFLFLLIQVTDSTDESNVQYRLIIVAYPIFFYENTFSYDENSKH